MISDRWKRRRGGALVFGLVLVACTSPTYTAGAADECRAVPPAAGPSACLRALSLKALQERLRVCAPARACGPAELQLAGITRPLGYVVHRGDHDVVLFGEADPTRPALHVESLLVALRNGFFAYASVAGNIRTYAYPGCTIDPRPAVIQQLESVKRGIFAADSSQHVERLLGDWRRVCGADQDVKVLGLPHETYFARILVKADYDMKSLADGTDDPGLPGLISVPAIHVAELKHQIAAGQRPTLSVGMNRFWFFPGRTRLSYDERGGMVEWLPVTILTNPTTLSRTGRIQDVAGQDPAADRFAAAMSLLFGQVAQARSIYAELDGLFRLVGVVKLLKEHDVFKSAGLDASLLLERMSLSRVAVPRAVPGRSAVTPISHRTERPDGYAVLNVWLPSCGGVEIRLDDSNTVSHRDGSGALAGIADAIAKGRPAAQALVWDVAVPMNPRLAVARQAALEGRKLPGSGVTALDLTIEDHGRGFVLLDRDQATAYGLGEMRTLAEHLRARVERAGVTAAYVRTRGFEPRKTEPLRSTLDRQLTALGVRGNVRLVADNDATRLLFMPGVRLEPRPRKVERVRDGTFRGWYRAVVTFATSLGGRVRDTSVIVLGRTADVLDDVLARLDVEFSVYNHLPLRVVDVLEILRADHLRRGKSLDDLRYQFEEPGYLHEAGRPEAGERG